MSRSDADPESPMTKHYLGYRACTPSRGSHPRVRRSLGLILGALPILAVMVCSAICSSQLLAQAPPQIVGRVEGRDFTVENPPGAPPNSGDLSKSISASLTSGNYLDVRSGQARIFLDGGGQIAVCGPARLQLLKSQGALTVALDYGSVHINIAGEDPITIFTPLIVATPVTIGGGAREATIGLDQSGQMCLRSSSGAVRVEQQLSGQSLLVPQFGQLSLTGGQLTAAAPSAPGCSCEIESAKVSPPRPPTSRDSVIVPTAVAKKPVTEPLKSVIAPPVPAQNSAAASAGVAEAPPTVDVPIYKVLMPPLVYDPSSPPPAPDPNPNMMILVRSVRVREDTIISGTIAPSANRNSRTLAEIEDPFAQQPQPGFFARIGGFFRRVFGGKS